MGSFSIWHWLIVLVIVLLVFALMRVAALSIPVRDFVRQAGTIAHV